MKYRADIDGLRALAIIPVILFHFIENVPLNGFMGVDIFFVLSGYLITRIIYDEIQQGNFSIVRFYERRVRRIFPALIFVLFCSLLAAYFLFLPKEMLAFGKSLLATVFFGSNFLFWSEAGYFDMEATFKPLLHTWSLAVEEQFYIFFPLILMGGYALFRKHLQAFVVTLLVLSLVFSLGLTFLKEVQTAFYMLPARAWELMMGAVVAIRILPVVKSEKAADSLTWLGLALIFIGFALPFEKKYFPGVYPVFPTLGTALIIYTGETYKSFVHSMLSKNVVVFTGKISYSLYLWHWPVYVFASYYLLSDVTAFYIAGLMAACFVLAIFSWKYIEQPFRGQAAVFTQGHLFVLAALSMGLLAGAAAFLVKTDGAVYKFGPETLRLAGSEVGAKLPTYENEHLPKNIFIFNDKPAAPQPSFAVWGDSHASAIAPAYALNAEKNNENGFLIVGNNCFISSAIKHELRKQDECIKNTDSSLRFLEKNKQVKTVILVNRWADHLAFWHKKRFAHDKAVALRAETLLEVVARLEKMGKKVIVVAQVPQVFAPSQDVSSLLARIDMYKRNIDLRAMVEKYKEHQKDMWPIYEKLGARVIWPHKFMCDKTVCELVKDGASLYYDDDHLSNVGAEYIAPYLKF